MAPKHAPDLLVSIPNGVLSIHGVVYSSHFLISCCSLEIILSIRIPIIASTHVDESISFLSLAADCVGVETNYSTLRPML